MAARRHILRWKFSLQSWDSSLHLTQVEGQRVAFPLSFKEVLGRLPNPQPTTHNPQPRKDPHLPLFPLRPW